jgi:hypothetical protein
LENLTSAQVSEWLAYDRIDPIGKDRDEYGWGMICSVVTNLAKEIYKTKGTTPKFVHPVDFIPKWGDVGKPKVQTVEEQKSILMAMVKRHNKRVKNG